MKKKGWTKKGLTLLEILVAVTIISLLAGLAYPAYQIAKAKAQESKASTVLAAVATAKARYTLENKVGAGFDTWGNIARFEAIQPYLKESTTFNKMVEKTGHQYLLVNDSNTGPSWIDNGPTGPPPLWPPSINVNGTLVPWVSNPDPSEYTSGNGAYELKIDGKEYSGWLGNQVPGNYFVGISVSVFYPDNSQQNAYIYFIREPENPPTRWSSIWYDTPEEPFSLAIMGLPVNPWPVPGR